MWKNIVIIVLPGLHKKIVFFFPLFFLFCLFYFAWRQRKKKQRNKDRYVNKSDIIHFRKCKSNQVSLKTELRFNYFYWLQSNSHRPIRNQFTCTFSWMPKDGNCREITQRWKLQHSRYRPHEKPLKWLGKKIISVSLSQTLCSIIGRIFIRKT